MQIEKCSSQTDTPLQPPAPVMLTYDEICKNEGIYKSSGGGSHVVVLRHGGELTTFFVGGDTAQPCMAVKSDRFVRVDGARLCLEIRKTRE